MSETADMSLLLIEKKMAGNYGLAPKRWLAQLEAIRRLPEAKRTESGDDGR